MQDEKQVVFEKGKVSEYNGQQDIYCDFVTVTQGAKKDVYYILNDKKLDNDFYIASTVLKEAIDPQILRTHLGLIDSKGNIAIPFENKMLKEVESKYLLAVRNEPKTRSVVDAVASRNDPTAAERMVNTNASVKDKLNVEMHNQGRFLLNDLLSEGTVYTLDGKNIFDNQYYSFIGMTDDSFYCSTNVPESTVVKVLRTDVFSVRPNDVIDEEKSNNDAVINPILPEVQPTEKVKKDTLDVAGVSVKKEKIEEALNSSIPVEEKNGISSLTQSTIKEEKVENDLGLHLPPISIDKPVNVKVSDIDVKSSDSDLEDSKTTTFSVINESAEDSEEVVEAPVDNIIPFKNNSSISNSEESLVDDGKVGDVVSAVSEIVQQNKDLEQQNKQFLARISELERENKSYHEQLQQNSDLRNENLRLVGENEKLTAANSGLRNAMNQIRQELGISSVSSEIQGYGYQKVA